MVDSPSTPLAPASTPAEPTFASITADLNAALSDLAAKRAVCVELQKQFDEARNKATDAQNTAQAVYDRYKALAAALIPNV